MKDSKLNFVRTLSGRQIGAAETEKRNKEKLLEKKKDVEARETLCKRLEEKIQELCEKEGIKCNIEDAMEKSIKIVIEEARKEGVYSYILMPDKTANPELSLKNWYNTFKKTQFKKGNITGERSKNDGR